MAKEEIDIEIERRTRDGGRRGEEEKIDIEIERKMRGGRGGRRAVEEELDIEIDRRYVEYQCCGSWLLVD